MIKLPGRKKETRRSPQIVQTKQSVFHYSSNRAQVEKSRDRLEPLDQAESKSGGQSFTRKAAFTVSAVIIVVACLFFSFIRSDPKVEIINNPALRNASEYEKIATQESRSGIQGYSKLTLNRQKIADKMRSEFPELSSVEVTTPIFAAGPVIKAHVTRPTMTLVANNNDYVLDERGVALVNTTASKSSIKTDDLPRVNDLSNTPLQIGKPALTSLQVVFISEIKHQSDAKHLTFEAVNLGAGGGELTVKYKDLNYVVKYNLYEDARKSFGTFYAAKEQTEKSSVKPAEYIDVRVPERAYIK